MKKLMIGATLVLLASSLLGGCAVMAGVHGALSLAPEVLGPPAWEQPVAPVKHRHHWQGD